MIGWFGIRGIGSLYYLVYAVNQGIDQPLAETLMTLVLWTIAASVVVHGLTAQPLMRLYRTGLGLSLRAAPPGQAKPQD